MKGRLEVVSTPNNCSSSIITGFPEDGYGNHKYWHTGWNRESVIRWLYKMTPLVPLVIATTTSYMHLTEEVLKELGWQRAKKCKKRGYEKTINLWYLDMGNDKIYNHYKKMKDKILAEDKAQREAQREKDRIKQVRKKGV